MPTLRIPADTSAVRAFLGAGRSTSAILANRQCELQPYHARRPRAISVTGEMIAYASPESTYAVTRRLLELARRSILIGIYDFTADHIKVLLLAAMQRGVKVTLMLDLDGRTGELPIFDSLKHFGADALPAPSCALPDAHHRFFSSSHEKVIVIDDEWTMVQSGNYSDNSIPLNEVDGGDPAHFVPGNRDCGLAVRSTRLAAALSRVLRNDIALLEGAAAQAMLAAGALDADANAALLAAQPASPPPTRFPSRTFAAKDVRVLPVLTPDNYMTVVPDLLLSAQRSILIEQQYIRPRQPAIARLLEAIAAARKARPELDVRIILARPIGGDPKDFQEIRDLGVAFGLTVGDHVRLLSPAHFVHCHNKLILIDGESVLVGSQNWSDTAVLKNREASLLVHFPDLTAHYAAIFEADWTTGQRTLGRAQPAHLFTPASLSAGGLVRLSPGDYDDV